MITTVIKYGGHALTRTDLRSAFYQDIAAIAGTGMHIVIVHGGGPQINNMLGRLSIQPEFVRGLRVTDAATLEVVEMVLCGQVNKNITRSLAEAGVSAVGISGQDGNLLLARQKDPALGQVGEITRVNPQILQTLLAANFVPVVAPLALSENFKPLNVNADLAASGIASALAADNFILISDVPGVLDAESRLQTALNSREIEKMLLSGVISGGMIPKVEACLSALESGCGRAIILDGRGSGSLGAFLAGQEMKGTVITKN